KIGNHFSIININKEGHELFAVTYNQNSELTLEPYNPYVPSPQSQRFYIGNKSGQPHPPLPMAIKSCLDAGHHIVARDGASEDSPLLTKEFEEMQPDLPMSDPMHEKLGVLCGIV
ncbi:13083_t:CDS:2, partial [Funneliformis caledonium]